MAQLIHDFIDAAARRAPLAQALRYQGAGLNYAALAQMVSVAAGALLNLGLQRGERVAIYLEKREEAVVAMFGAAAAGAVFVPVNPLLKPGQVGHILADCGVRILVTTRQRLDQLQPVLACCPALCCVVLLGSTALLPLLPGVRLLPWHAWMNGVACRAAHRCIDSDLAAILYTAGSGVKPKGVLLSHRNLVAGALSVASCLDNRATDRILCLLPFSLGYGLSQLTTAFASGACAVLMNHLLLRDVVDMVEREHVTGLAAVPSLWQPLSQLCWPDACLRYITSSGGALPCQTLQALRSALPATRIHLMYGLTEALRSTCLRPDQLDSKPGSIGRALPNAEVLVLRADGSECAPGEAGELVHCGAQVAQGYWNDAAGTAERFRPLPPRQPGRPFGEIALWSGDTVRRDEDGDLYFIGRSDDMIKTSGYRVSPREVEDAACASGLVAEAVALGLPHPLLGQAIVLLVAAAPGVALDSKALMTACRALLPAYMAPAWIDVRRAALPRNPHGEIDRKALAAELSGLFTQQACA
ncbi:MAG: acyl-CoA ligase (AMP-forming), exosortase A system-associated [Pseudomonadota bacterium]